MADKCQVDGAALIYSAYIFAQEKDQETHAFTVNVFYSTETFLFDFFIFLN